MAFNIILYLSGLKGDVMRPHALDTALITENAFQLVVWCSGNHHVLDHFLDDGDHNSFGPTKPNFIYHLQKKVCELLIVTATKIRILQDSLTDTYLDHEELIKPDKRITTFNPCAQELHSLKNLSIRETCNKIIHATSVAFIMCNKDGHKERFLYWSEDLYGFWFSGVVELHGKIKGKEWIVTLEPSKLGVNIISYIHELESEHEIYRAWE